MIKKMAKCTQPVKWHPEGNVLNHTILVLDSAVKAQDEELYFACAWHDVGKVYTRKEVEDKIIFYGHEDKSATAYYLWSERSSYGMNIETLRVIEDHMRMHLYLNGKLSNLTKRERMEKQENFEDLKTFAKHDDAGRILGQHVVITIGISGSGKSTWVNSHKDKYEVVCPDDIRRELTGNISDQSKNKEVWKEAYTRIEKLITQGKNVILDSTMVNTKSRREFSAFVKSLGVNICYNIFPVSPTEAKLRVSKDVESGVDRSNTPPEVIDRQWQQFKQSVKDIREEHFLVIN